MEKSIAAGEDNLAEAPETERSPIIVNMDSELNVTILVRKDLHELISTAGIAGESPDEEYFILKNDHTEKAQEIIGGGDSMVSSSSDDPPCQFLPRI